MLHMIAHLIVPGLVGRWFFVEKWKKAWFIMVVTMLVDLDHLLASPVFDPNRCSINFHPLHSYWAIVLYFVLVIPQWTRLIGLGLLIHMGLDGLDCVGVKYFLKNGILPLM